MTSYCTKSRTTEDNNGSGITSVIPWYVITCNYCTVTVSSNRTDVVHTMARFTQTRCLVPAMDARCN